jgi:hypothetical protein
MPETRKVPLGGTTEIPKELTEVSDLCNIMCMAEVGIMVLYHGIRLGARDESVDCDMFHDRKKSMYKLKSDGIEDDRRERKHDELREKRRDPESQGGPSPIRQYLYASSR